MKAYPKLLVLTQPSYTPEEQEINEQFIEAALNDEWDTVTTLLKNPNLDVNIRANDEYYGTTVLQLAIEEEDMYVVQKILNHKNIDINAGDANGHTALEVAINLQNTEIINVLLSRIKNLKTNNNELLGAAYMNNLHVFQILLEYHPDKYFIKNHALEIFAKAAKIIDGVEPLRGDFLEFVMDKLIEQISPKEALEICIKAIPSFGGFEPAYEIIFAEYVLLPVFKKELNDYEIVNIFDKTIADLNKNDPYISNDISMSKRVFA